MTNAVLFNLQAASMAAAVNSGQKLPGTEDIPDGGMNFSEILASQTSPSLQTGTAVSAEETEIPAEEAEVAIGEKTDNSVFAEAMKLIENADDTVKKALSLLLKTVINAMRGSSDGEERKTDIFMIISDGSADFSDEDGLTDDSLLLSAEIMNRLGLMLEGSAAEKDTELDTLLGELEEIVSEILGIKDDDSDETAAADALAAMLNMSPGEIESLYSADGEVKSEAIEQAAEALKTPMSVIEQEAPEKLPEAEKLYSEFAAEVVSKTEDVPETVSRAGFSALKINNVSDQIGNIGRRISSGPEVSEQIVRTEISSEDANASTGKDDKSESGPAAEIAAAGVSAETETVFVRGEIGTENNEARLDRDTAVSVENQVKDVVTDEISEFGDKDGVKELVLILRPKELGQIAVKLVKEANTVSVIMSAQYEEVGKLMTQRAAYLGESLSDKSYDVKDVQVVEPGNAAEQMGLNFTDHGFSFARNSGNSENGGSGRSYRSENDSYGEIDGIEEIGAVQGDIRFREAKLWTTA